MRFNYEYRSSDNARHTDVVTAASRDAAYLLLKTRGIRPSRLVEAPGLLNKLFGKGKRWTAILVLAALVVVSAFVIRSGRKEISRIERQMVSALPRHQIDDLPSGWQDQLEQLFPDGLDRILSRYAQPGVVLSAPRGKAGAPSDLNAPAYDELRRVVAGMRREADGFLRLGKTVEELERFLEERQNMEAQYRERLISQVRTGELGRQEANRILTAMELQPIGN